MGAVQLNTRMEADLKAQGDAVLSSHGVSGTEAVRSLWRHMALTQSLPSFMAPAEEADGGPATDIVAEEPGFAIRIARSLGLHADYPEPARDSSDAADDHAGWKEAAYRERYGRLMGDDA